jgi:acetyltransferase-like isoleucine patch superfamily enzyme
MTPDKYTNVTGGEVRLRKYSQIGAGTVIMPNLTIGEGVAVGAMSFVKHDVRNWNIVAGNPLKFLRYRSEGLLKLVQQYKYEV